MVVVEKKEVPRPKFLDLFNDAITEVKKENGLLYSRCND
jgi:hypothetical protein